MRVLLDVHVSGRKVARRLRELGHDVLAVDEDRDLDGVDDEELLKLAEQEHRILVTFDVKDFSRITRDWAARQVSHGGCAVLVGIDHREFELIVRRLEAAFALRPEPDDWSDLLWFVSRAD
ncbi:MAG TPA: DUF5615 family PIN-like protein [Chloroflexota bacterium]